MSCQPRCASHNAVAALSFRAASKVLSLAVLASMVLTAGCAAEQPHKNFSPQLASGITSNNGGGQRALGGMPNMGVTTAARPTGVSR